MSFAGTITIRSKGNNYKNLELRLNSDCENKLDKY